MPEQYGDPSISYQCSYCHKFFAGPDKGYNPGREVTRAPKAGGRVSHGGACPECRGASGSPKAYEQQMAARYGANWQEKVKAAQAAKEPKEPKQPDKPPDETNWYWRERRRNGGEGG